jgi:hypothetical protein
VSAALAEALSTVTAGAVAAFATAVIALFFKPRRVHTIRLADAILGGIGVVFVLALPVVIVVILKGDLGWAVALARIVTVAGWLGLALLIASFAALRTQPAQPRSLTFVALGASFVIGIATWLLQRQLAIAAATGDLPF